MFENELAYPYRQTNPTVSLYRKKSGISRSLTGFRVYDNLHHNCRSAKSQLISDVINQSLEGNPEKWRKQKREERRIFFWSEILFSNCHPKHSMSTCQLSSLSLSLSLSYSSMFSLRDCGKWQKRVTTFILYALIISIPSIDDPVPVKLFIFVMFFFGSWLS